MTPEQIAALIPGDRVFRWVWVGTSPSQESHEIQELTVVRVNPTTVTVDTDHHGRIRVRHADIVDYVTWENETAKPAPREGDRPAAKAIDAAAIRLSKRHPVTGRPNGYRERWFQHDGVVFHVGCDELHSTLWFIQPDTDHLEGSLDLLSFIQSPAYWTDAAFTLIKVRTALADLINSPQFATLRDAYTALPVKLRYRPSTYKPARWWVVEGACLSAGGHLAEAPTARQAAAQIKRTIESIQQGVRHSKAQARAWVRAQNIHTTRGPLTSRQAYEYDLGWKLAHAVNRSSNDRGEPANPITPQEAAARHLAPHEIERITKSCALIYAQPYPDPAQEPSS
ncbi:hypothetical protein [Nonomuraea sp. SYSU D8015]|uniref:hypothetical protein n=1 Tax=Nonomuraea sp. SYSU D8015 TaxID=2593644 RepID=UPI0016616A9B|nr:hypothetical protein [Nonomuraea sp. SYSU D8015]